MTKSRLSIFFDTFLISTIICFLVYIWINRYLKNAFFSFFICIFAYILMFFIIFKNLTNKFNKSKLSKLDMDLSNKYFQFLTYSKSDHVIKYFENLLNAKYLKDNLFYNDKFYFYINIKTNLTPYDFHIANEFYLNSNKTLPLLFIGKSTTDEFTSLNNNSPNPYNVLLQDSIFLLMKKLNNYPVNVTIKNYKFDKLKKFKDNAIKSFSKKHFFKFLFSGLSLITISIFIPFSLYYLFSGTLLLIFSIICLFSKNSNNNQTNIDISSLIKKD